MSVELEVLTKYFSPEAARAILEAARSAARSEVSARVRERPAVEEELTVRQVAEIKEVRPKTVYEWRRRGLLRSHRTPTGRVRFYRKDVEAI